jgi:hypothetical protein
MKALLRTCLLLTSLLGFSAIAAEPSEADIDRLTDLVVKAMPMGIVFDDAMAKDPNWPLEDKAKNLTADQLACVRGELSAVGYRKGKRAEVVKYAQEHPANVERDIELLSAGAAELFSRFVLAGANQAAGGGSADVDAIISKASAAEGMSLVQLTTGAQYAELRTLIGFGAMFDEPPADSSKMQKRGEDQGMQLGAMLMIKAVGACNLPLSVFK